MSQELELVKQFYTAFQNKDAVFMASCYHSDASFQDEVFTLQGEDVGHMRAMLCARGKDMTLTFRDISVNANGQITCHWEPIKDLWTFIKNDDGLIHLNIDEVLEELHQLKDHEMFANHSVDENFPFVLMAGERRSYNANQIFRNPDWRKIDKHGAMKIHPKDAEHLQLSSGDKAICASETGQLDVVVEIDDAVRQGVVTLPHGYGMRYQDNEALGPALNMLTSGKHCDPFSKTPYHKYVPVNLKKL